MFNDNQARDFLRLANRLGFTTEIAPRRSNAHPNGVLNRAQEQQVRSILDDYAEFIVPVFWSESEFVGLPQAELHGEIDRLLTGAHLVDTAARLEGQNAPLPSWATGSRYVGYQEAAYFRNTVSGVSLQSPRLRRQGYLAICRKSIQVVGIFCDFQPSFDNSTLRFDEAGVYSTLFWILPPAAEYPIDVVARLPLSEIGEIRSTELVRFDGFAAYLAATESQFASEYRGASRRFEKRFRKMQIAATKEVSKMGDSSNRSQPELRMFFKQFIALRRLLEEDEGFFAKEFQGCFQRATEYLTTGTSVANGTGVDDQGMSIRTLFNAALGVAITSDMNGRKFFLESPFSELDLAVDVIGTMSSQSTSVTDTAALQSPSSTSSANILSDELRKLAELFQAGLLTESEFAEAKAATLKKL